MSYVSRLVLVVNSGSSSLKFTVLPVGGGTALVSGLAECLGLPQARLVIKENGVKSITDLHEGDHNAAIAAILSHLDRVGLLEYVAVVGHRVVQGGDKFTQSVLVTDEVIAAIEEVAPLAPLHNPANLMGLKACRDALPGVPQAVVFDTAFHTTMPEAAYTYAVPQVYQRQHGVRRYGAHGTSHRIASSRPKPCAFSDCRSTITASSSLISATAPRRRRC